MRRSNATRRWRIGARTVAAAAALAALVATAVTGVGGSGPATAAPPSYAEPVVEISDATAEESDGVIVFELSLNKPTLYGGAWAYVELRDGTAKRGADYEGRKYKATFKRGESTTTIEVPLVVDAADEPEEYLYAEIVSAQRAIRGRRLAQGFIGEPGNDVLRVTRSTDGDLPGTLRWAIEESNARPGVQQILFAKRGTEPLVVQPMSLLPSISDAVVIDGSLDNGTDAIIDGSGFIDIDNALTDPSVCPGANPGTFGPDTRTYSNPGLHLLDVTEVEIANVEVHNFCIGIMVQRSGHNVIHDVVTFNNLGGAGIMFTGDDGTGTIVPDTTVENLVYETHIIDSPDGAEFTRGSNYNTIRDSIIEMQNPDLPNPAGIEWVSSGNDVVERVVFRNYRQGLQMNGDGNVIVDNTFVDNDWGIRTRGGDTRIGGNTFRGSEIAAVEIRGGATGFHITENSIAETDGLGIDLDPSGPNVNDYGVDCGDGLPDCDDGANLGQNYPVLGTDSHWTGTDVALTGVLSSRPNADYVVEFFANPAGEADEGEFFLGSETVTTDGVGNASFDVTLDTSSISGLGTALFTATATDADGNTSEFSAGQELDASEAPPAAALAAVSTPGDADFPKVGGNLGNQQYTSLDAISRDNVAELGGAWENHLEGGIDVGNSNGQSSAVAVDGVLYVESNLGNVFAVDGATGETIWEFEQPRGTLDQRRGVAVGGGFVFTKTQDDYVVALDKLTGKVVWERQYDGLGNVEKVALTYFGGRLFVGTNDGSRGAAFTVDASNGDLLWHFFGTPGPGEFGNDTWEGDSWETGGATPWMHPAIDPELNMVYWTFGNARGNNGPQDGSGRGGQNLFGNSIVAMDLDTGEYQWHFQSIHHDIWDMDNVMAPVLYDAEIDGELRHLVLYGSKTGMYYILDRATGEPALGISEVAVPQEPRQKTWPTQPFPDQGPWADTCVVDQPLGTEVPGHPSRAVPNFINGCLYDPHWDELVLTVPGIGGASDWNAISYNQHTGLMYSGFTNTALAHAISGAGNVGYRPPGEYMTGGVVAVDPTTNLVEWKVQLPYDMSHGNGVLSTPGDVIFVGQPDGNLLALDAHDGSELWRFQLGAAISTSPLMYEVDGEQYLAVFTGGTSIPYGSSIPRGDSLWAFKLGGAVPEAAAPPPPNVRRPVSGGPVDGADVDYTVTLARTYNAGAGTVGDTESTSTSAMAPTHMVVSVGTTVTFLNPADNVNTHCATQFFEGLFNPVLAPGESFEFTFTEVGEYFYNDCYDPRPTGKIEVVAP